MGLFARQMKRHWLLVHPDLKAVPRVRHVMQRIRGVFKASRAPHSGDSVRVP